MSFTSSVTGFSVVADHCIWFQAFFCPNLAYFTHGATSLLTAQPQMLAFYATMLVDSLKLLVIRRGEERATEVWLTHNFRSFSFPDLFVVSSLNWSWLKWVKWNHSRQHFFFFLKPPKTCTTFSFSSPPLRWMNFLVKKRYLMKRLSCIFVSQTAVWLKHWEHYT